MSPTNPFRRGFLTLPAALLALAAALGSPAQATVSDFRLPPAPDEPQPTRQGPIAPDVPESRIRPVETPSAAPSPPPEIVVPPLPAVTATGEPATGRPRQPAAPPPDRAATSPPPTTEGSAPDPAEPEAPPVPATTPAPIVEASEPTPAPAIAATGEDSGSWWIRALLALVIAALLGVSGWYWHRRRSAKTSAPPQVERPRVVPVDSPPPPPDEAPPVRAVTPGEAAEPLRIALEPLRLSLTLLNATLAYRLEVTNRGAAAIENLQIGADMISAHASMSREEQLSGPSPEAAVVERIERLEPGESRTVAGEFRLPFPQIVPIRQGSLALLMPLARFRLEAAGAAPLVRTFVVGQPGAGNGLQPFRLDQGPRVYPTLAQRAFA